MNKTELVGVVAEKTGMNRKDADKAINMVFESIVESLGNGEKVQVLGFGTFVSPIILGVQSPIYSTAVGLIHYVQQAI